MLQTVKPLYWWARERLPMLAASLRSDPPAQRLRRQLAAYARHTVSIGDICVQLSPQLGGRVVAYILSGDYEAPERRILEHALDDQDIVLELGSGIGYLSAFCAKRIGGERVFTFEANPALEPIIRRNYQLNAVRPSLEICMLGESAGETEFFVTRNFWSSSTIRAKGPTKTVRVRIQPFNDAFARIRPTVLVIDIEGGEQELVRHMRLDGVRTICIELHPRVIGEAGTSEVIGRFLDAGFEEVESVSDDEHKLFVRAPSRPVTEQ